jgi:hypothetical protein
VLERLYDVPSFDATTEQAGIARNSLHGPIKDWQRPIIAHSEKATASRFSAVGKFLPNLVVVAVHDPGRSVSREVLNN